VFAELAGNQPETNPETTGDPSETKLGLVVRDLSQTVVGRIHASGVEIESVRTGSFADLQGLEPGLVITHVNRQPTATKDQFEAEVSKLKTGDDVVFEVVDPHHPEQGINYVGGTL
jgi:serine protease Do